MLSNLLNLAKCYRSVALVFTVIGDFHTYRTELLGQISNFNTVTGKANQNKDKATAEKEKEKCLHYYNLAQESASKLQASDYIRINTITQLSQYYR